MKNRTVRLTGLFVLCVSGLAVMAGFQVGSAFADVPDVLSVEFWTSGVDTVLNITVRHASPTGSHYVDRVELDVNGTVDDIGLSASQTAPSFVVQYSLGEVTGTPTVQARAHCTFHGWSGWSEPVIIPEFPAIHLSLILVFASFAVLLFKVKIHSWSMAKV